MSLLGDPDFTNEIGVKWWHVSTHGAYQAWLTRHPEHGDMYVVIDQKEHAIVYESQKIDEASTKAEMLSLVAKFAEDQA